MSTEKNQSPVSGEPVFDEGTEGVPVPMPARVDDPGLLAKVFDRATVSGPGALSHKGDVVPRQYIDFDVSGSDCAPGMFVDESGASIVFKLGLKSPTSSEEIKITKGMQDPAEVVQAMVKASLNTVNGAPIVGEQIDFMWEALGATGRQLAQVMYQEIGAISPVGLGKAQASSSRG